MTRRLILAVCCAALGLPVHAADAAKTQEAGKPAAAGAKTPGKKAGEKADKKEQVTESDVIGSQDAPMVFNIVPWKDKDASLPKNDLDASVLRETLDPIDRDVVRREVDFSRALQSMPMGVTPPTP